MSKSPLFFITLIALAAADAAHAIEREQPAEAPADAAFHFPVSVEAKLEKRHRHFGLGVSMGYSIHGRQAPTLVLEVGKVYTFALDNQCDAPLALFEQSDGSSAASLRPLTTEADGVAIDEVKATCSMRIQFTPQPHHLGRVLLYDSSVHEYMGGDIKVVNQTFCNRYSSALGLTNHQFIEAVCNMTFFNLAHSGPGMIEFFTGQFGPVNYFADPAALDALRERLVAYFGNELGCSEPGYPLYRGPSMRELHANLPIGRAEFAGFNKALLDAMSTVGVPEHGVLEMRTFLESFFGGKPYGVCNFNDCKTSTCDTLSSRLFGSGNDANAKFVGVLVNRAQERLSASTGQQLADGAELRMALGHHALLSCTQNSFEPASHRGYDEPKLRLRLLKHVSGEQSAVDSHLAVAALAQALSDLGADEKQTSFFRHQLTQLLGKEQFVDPEHLPSSTDVLVSDTTADVARVSKSASQWYHIESRLPCSHGVLQLLDADHRRVHQGVVEAPRSGTLDWLCDGQSVWVHGSSPVAQVRLRSRTRSHQLASLAAEHGADHDEL